MKIMEEVNNNRSSIVSVYLLLAIVTLIVYIQVAGHEFVSFDDDWYIYNNPYVKSGLTSESIQWAFGFTEQVDMTANWHPLTALSHIVDGQLYGLDPTGHHVTNVILHIVNGWLLFMVLKLMTKRLWPSAFVAALFALHPLHVESVAWASERKDVLSTLFWLLTMIAYTKYVKRPGIIRYLLIMLAMAFGLLAKPMLVTLPFVLLLLDYWPLNRFEWKRLPKLVLEKVPLFLLSAAMCIVILLAQRTSLAVAAKTELPFNIRIANALVSYLKYIGKTLWPKDLAFFYPLPLQKLPLWIPAISLLVLIIISVTVLMVKKRYLLTGWFWYLGTLVPVIGIVQIGRQAMADRYTYVPLIGLFIVIAWGLPDLLDRVRNKRPILSVLSIASLLIISMISFVQVKYWANSVALYERATKVENNWWAHHLLANELLKKGQFDKAVENYERALEIRPGSVEAMKDLAYAYLYNKKYQEAINLYLQFLPELPEITGPPDTSQISSNFVPQTAKEDATLRFYIESRLNIAIAYEEIGKLDEAVKHLMDLLRIKPGHALGHKNLGLVFLRQNKLDKAIEHFNKAIELEPKSYRLRYELGHAYLSKDMPNEAVDEYMKVLTAYPKWSGLMATVANIIATNKDCKYYDPKHALKLAQSSCELENYQHAGLLDNLAAIYAVNNDYVNAVASAQEALDIAIAKKQNAFADQIKKRLEIYKTQKAKAAIPSEKNSN